MIRQRLEATKLHSYISYPHPNHTHTFPDLTQIALNTFSYPRPNHTHTFSYPHLQAGPTAAGHHTINVDTIQVNTDTIQVNADSIQVNTDTIQVNADTIQAQANTEPPDRPHELLRSHHPLKLHGHTHQIASPVASTAPSRGAHYTVQAATSGLVRMSE